MNNPRSAFWKNTNVLVVGGGAAGFFAAIHAAMARPGTRVSILEKSSNFLSKLRASGGGRCNVTHACFDPKELATHYPRGCKELIGPFHRWQPADTVAWFRQYGVALKVEADGRMFPTSDDSRTIMDCLIRAARDLRIETRTRMSVHRIDALEDSFEVALDCGEVLRAPCVIVAAGSLKNNSLASALERLGHTIAPLAPSLFAFDVDDPRIQGLAGVSISKLRVKIPSLKLEQEGPLAITHSGLSGPVILKLSAWGARELAQLEYRFAIEVDWTGGQNPKDEADGFSRLAQIRGGSRLCSHGEWRMPKRLWSRLVRAAGIPQERVWSQLRRDEYRALAKEVTACELMVSGKTLNKEEFVTCGGVNCREVDFRNMESRIVPGLFFAGEILDIDGLTGGFNFQAAWTTGYLAGTGTAVLGLPSESKIRCR